MTDPGSGAGWYWTINGVTLHGGLTEPMRTDGLPVGTVVDRHASIRRHMEQGGARI